MTRTFPIDATTLKSLNFTAKPIKINEGDPAFADLLAVREHLSKPVSIPFHMADNHPSKTYAEIVKNGQVIGKVYDGGTAETSNAVGAKLRSFFEQTDDRDQRAEAIAKATGGQIRYV